ncbi:Polyprenol-phosphate-mannose-dependent alpha-(1-2)-phosphatidylinositol mannoside mannosyltransferase [Caballeronia calidae]|uniref:Polyprenol-phosphate-mannose-dependent alpha-(1-2)-phosphatidylinositol mannoside mannosyltransferase n=1 Tax=Caballeronia calidae TaxID=1777139 RepID=A0A158CFJ7_9BURK|nr:glycosyltransferase family 87 protein [Caballeronia calidae]SAK81104.1 Polyprenol-phosphate-mannose-dependent alpha-(1-2)-phosphatidylinositol mannoside mannosyltransferase [Caballeronia calidae]
MLNARVGARSADNVRTIAALLMLVAAGFLAIRMVIVYHYTLSYGADHPRAFSDFNFYYYAFSTVLNSAHDPSLLYNNERLVSYISNLGANTVNDILIYCYPPQFALIFSPFALLPSFAAKLTWVAMSVVLCIVGAILLAKMAYRGEDKRVTALLIAVTLLSFPVLHDAYLGQSNELLFFLLATAFFLVERGNRWAAGVFLALAVVFKVTPLAVVGLLLLRREWRTVVSTGIWAIALTLFTASQLGFRIIWDYFTVEIARAQTHIVSAGGLPGNSSVRGALQTVSERLGMPASEATLHATSTIFAAIVCLLACYLVLRRSQDRRMDYGLACITMLLAAPILEPIHMVVALIPLAILLGTALERWDVRQSAIVPRAEIVLLALAVFLLFFMERSAMYTVSALLTWVLCVARYFLPASERRLNPQVDSGRLDSRML